MTTAVVEVLGTCWTASVASTLSSTFNKETLSPKLRWRTMEDSHCLSLACMCVHACKYTSIHMCTHACTPPTHPKELFGFCYLEPEAKESRTLEMPPLSIVFSIRLNPLACVSWAQKACSGLSASRSGWAGRGAEEEVSFLGLEHSWVFTALLANCTE